MEFRKFGLFKRQKLIEHKDIYVILWCKWLASFFVQLHNVFRYIWIDISLIFVQIGLEKLGNIIKDSLSLYFGEYPTELLLQILCRLQQKSSII